MWRIGAGAFLGWSLGANDAANVFGTAVAAQVVRYGTAVVLTAIFVMAGAVILGLATLATTALVFLLSLRLRRRERVTLFKIGGARSSVAGIMASEIVAVLVVGGLLAATMTLLTDQFGSVAIRAIIRNWN